MSAMLKGTLIAVALTAATAGVALSQGYPQQPGGYGGQQPGYGGQPPGGQQPGGYGGQPPGGYGGQAPPTH